MESLYLTKAEHALLQQRLPRFTETYVFLEESIIFADSVRRMMLRLALVRLHHPSLITLREKVSTAPTLDDAVAVIAQYDLKGVPDEELSQIIFALGPDVIGQVIWMLIQNSSQQENALNQIAILSFLRHEVLSAYDHVR